MFQQHSATVQQIKTLGLCSSEHMNGMWVSVYQHNLSEIGEYGTFYTSIL